MTNIYCHFNLLQTVKLHMLLSFLEISSCLISLEACSDSHLGAPQVLCHSYLMYDKQQGWNDIWMTLEWKSELSTTILLKTVV